MSTLGAIKGPVALVANTIAETISKKAHESGVKEVKDLEDFGIEVDQLQLASLKQGLIDLADKDTTGEQITVLLLVSKDFKIKKTVEAGIKAKLPTELSVDELDAMVELDVE